MVKEEEKEEERGMEKETEMAMEKGREREREREGCRSLNITCSSRRASARSPSSVSSSACTNRQPS